mmetsp:Transcript_14784/g.21864  ORF Transcript_14784/g.21864 Transcript_14784/m.21864 type:complete len:723 (-) Transcript_14784:89-2257(-)
MKELYLHSRSTKDEKKNGDKAMSQDNVWKLYCKNITPGEILRGTRALCGYFKDEEKERNQNIMEDPREPRDSYPDRIVECFLITDERQRETNLLDGDRDSGFSCLENERHPAPKIRFFIQRRFLTQIYYPFHYVYVCSFCGYNLTTKSGLTSHLKLDVCHKKSKRLGEKISERIQTRESLLISRKNYTKPKCTSRGARSRATMTPDQREHERERDRARKKRKRTRPNKTIYSGLFVFLQFRRGGGYHAYRPQKIRKTRSKRTMYPETFNFLLFLKEGTSPCHKQNEKQRLRKLQARAQSPPKPKPKPKTLLDEILLEEKTKTQQQHTLFKLIPEAAQVPPPEEKNEPIQSPNAIYPSVFYHLSFTKGNQSSGQLKRKRSALPEDSGGVTKLSEGDDSQAIEHNGSDEPVDPTKSPKKKRRRRSSGATPRPAPQPVIVDMMVLVEEVDTGRYPSIKRYEGEHSDSCAICKKKGTLFCCEFCSNAEHMECLRERLTIREPEPDDDFMCHKCIQTILARRARAEKRRLRKRDHALSKAGIAPVPEVNLEGKEPITTNLESHIPFEPMPTATAAGAHAEVATPAMRAAANVTREIYWKDELASHVESYQACPTGGPGGLICCDFCTASYSRLMCDTSKEMERQTISKVGREVSEMLELLRDAQLRMQQAVEVAKANDERRSLLSSNEVETECSTIINDQMGNNVNTSAVGMLDIVQICNQNAQVSM